MNEDLIPQVQRMADGAARLSEQPPYDGPRTVATEQPIVSDRATADQTMRLAEHGASVLVVVNPLAGVVLDLQRLLNLCLAYVPASEDRLRGEIVAALAVRPTGGA